MYEAGKKEGESTSYYKNGNMKSKGQYENGVKDEEWIWYYENGNVKSKGSYDEGELEDTELTTYTEDGTIKVINDQNGVTSFLG